MKKTNVYDYAKWFLDNNLDNPRNTFKGNMKLQKLLFFAQLISLAKNGRLLFDEEFCAFENGMVMEDIRLTYKNNLNKLLSYDKNNLTKEDIEILELTKNIYGEEDADTLSNMSHQFEYWKKYLNSSMNDKAYRNKDKAIVPNEELKNELDNIRDVLDAYEIINKQKDEEEDFDY